MSESENITPQVELTDDQRKKIDHSRNDASRIANCLRKKAEQLNKEFPGRNFMIDLITPESEYWVKVVNYKIVVTCMEHRSAHYVLWVSVDHLHLHRGRGALMIDLHAYGKEVFLSWSESVLEFIMEAAGVELERRAYYSGYYQLRNMQPRADILSAEFVPSHKVGRRHLP